MSYIIKCDRCSKLGPEVNKNSVPEGWKNIGFSVYISGDTRYKWHQFCPECSKHLQIQSTSTEETSAEKLVSILEAIIEEKIDERE